MNGEIPSAERVDLMAAIEPEAAAAAKGTPTLYTAEVAALSSAISLKRIADALSPPPLEGGGAPAATAYELLDTITDAVTGKGPSFLAMPLNQYGESIGECIEGQFNRGQR